MTLQDLTEACRRAILDPHGCSDDDFAEAERAGLVVLSWRGGNVPDGRHLHHRGAAILAAAKRIDPVVGGYVTTASGGVARIMQVDAETGSVLIDDGTSTTWCDVASLHVHPHGGISYTDA